ncbi:MAG: L-threonylcarbamoyladenylate synthase [Candidatus Nitrospinota bacterium M3_3B_026]
MRAIHLKPDRPSYKPLREAAEIVLDGGVMVYPTDTIYGLGCDAFSKSSIERISRIKKRDPAKPFSFVCHDIGQISEFAFVSNWAYRLVKKLLPGPYTFILEARKTNIPKKMLGKRNTVGVRIPGSPICQRLVELVGHPIVSTSVNLAGGEPLTDPVMLPEDFSRYIDIIISVGPLVSVPSTVVDLTGEEPVVLREGKGAITWQAGGA